MTYLQEPVRKRMTISVLQSMRENGEKIAMLTCYDASFAAMLDRCNVDAILVGDSLGNVCQGHATTLPVTVEQMIYHTECVARGIRSTFVVADLPFSSYATPDDAFRNAARLMQAGAHMVKLEGGAWLAPTVAFLVERGIPVCAHIGLTPQSVHALGGFRVQGKTDGAARQLIEDALALEAAGCALLVMEAIPAALADDVTQRVAIPTIGIGAGPGCSGQVLVLYDAIGVFPGRKAKFVKNFMEARNSIDEAIASYVDEVKSGAFPAPEHTFPA
ncbi:3-methyl-2-oxobutanoate hydroxymethyltransferase [Paraburkholderia sp. B3]|uniref:3-methyl-2-oxobutanoate hydroxymethyltransferase n=1 Tax=Paraburkholderia sp. B3 TaxID=3134791 RepID=UPI003981A8CF